MVKYIKNTSSHRLLKNIQLYEIEFSDMSHIPSLSKDCFGIIKEFCGISLCGNLLNVRARILFWFACEHGLYSIIGKSFEMTDKQSIFGSGDYHGFYEASKNNRLKVLVWMKNEFPDLINEAVESCEYYISYEAGEAKFPSEVYNWMRTEFPDLINMI